MLVIVRTQSRVCVKLPKRGCGMSCRVLQIETFGSEPFRDVRESLSVPRLCPAPAHRREAVNQNHARGAFRRTDTILQSSGYCRSSATGFFQVRDDSIRTEAQRDVSTRGCSVGISTGLWSCGDCSPERPGQSPLGPVGAPATY